MVFQLGAAILDACVLAVVNEGDAYGYILTQNIKKIVDVSESTLYPVLRRLQKENLLSFYDEPFNGRNRRFYRITDAGSRKLLFYLNEWKNFKNDVDEILLGGSGND